MNARSAPARVGVAHLTDEIANFRRYRRAAIAMPTFPSPIKPKPLATPRDDGLRLDHQQRRSCPSGSGNLARQSPARDGAGARWTRETSVSSSQRDDLRSSIVAGLHELEHRAVF